MKHSLLGSPEDMSILSTCETNSRCVDDGHESLNVFHQHTVEETLVSFLNPHEIDVPVQINLYMNLHSKNIELL